MNNSTGPTTKENKRNEFNTRLLTIARQARGYTQTELADRAAIPPSRLSKIENGIVAPTSRDIGAFVQALEFPASFFSQQDNITAVGQSIYHRKQKSMPKRHLDKIEANLNIRHMHFQKLLRSVELENIDLPHFDVDDFGSPEDVARQARLYWRIPRGPIANLTGLLESKGAIVVFYDFASRKVSGETIADGRYPPVIFINTPMPPDRIRWTLAHEIAHYIMHRVPTATMEREADRFTAEFLTPASEILPMLRDGISLQRLYDLKLYWKVSMASLLMRAHALKLTTDSQREYWWRVMSSEGYRTREPGEAEIPVEFPELATNMVKYHTDQLGYSPSELCELLALNDQEFRSIYLSAGRKLSLVS